MLRLCPISITDAKLYVSKYHRHNLPPVGALFAIGVENGDGLCGVAIVGRPIARMLQDGKTCEILRVCTDGTRNANSMLYGACRRAAIALGYTKGITYTLESESGASLRAAGWMLDKTFQSEASWDGGNRHREQTDLFGNDRRPLGKKKRWTWVAQLEKQEEQP